MSESITTYSPTELPSETTISTQTTNTPYSPTEPPSDPTNPPKPSESLSSLDLSTDICSNKLDKTIKGFSETLKQEKDSDLVSIGKYLENKKIPTESKIDSIKKVLRVMLKNADEKKRKITEEKIKHEEMLKKKRRELEQNKLELNEIENQVTTKNREYEIDEGRYKLMVFETDLLKKFLFCCFTLFIFVILKQANVISKGGVIVMYLTTLTAIKLYFFYQYKTNRENKDNMSFDKIDFQEPQK